MKDGSNIGDFGIITMSESSNEASVPAVKSCFDNDEIPALSDSEVELRNLALRATATCHNPQTADGQWRRVLYPDVGSSLDPQSPSFDGHLWVKTFVDLYNSNLAATPRSLGVAFRNLTVSGSSSGAKYQTTTGNVFLGAAQSLARRVAGVQQSKQVAILQDFEGVLDAGELLLVLGPPGSGCSTLLKTIAGETAGLLVSDETEWNYRGKYSDYIPLV